MPKKHTQGDCFTACSRMIQEPLRGDTSLPVAWHSSNSSILSQGFKGHVFCLQLIWTCSITLWAVYGLEHRHRIITVCWSLGHGLTLTCFNNMIASFGTLASSVVIPVAGLSTEWDISVPYSAMCHLGSAQLPWHISNMESKQLQKSEICEILSNGETYLHQFDKNCVTWSLAQLA